MAKEIVLRVRQKFKKAGYFGLAGFFFLRFVIPALVSPDSYGITTVEISLKQRRGLVLIGKCIQNIANRIMFGEKEPYMVALNPLLENNFDACRKFFDKLVGIPIILPDSATESKEYRLSMLEPSSSKINTK